MKNSTLEFLAGEHDGVLGGRFPNFFHEQRHILIDLGNSDGRVSQRLCTVSGPHRVLNYDVLPGAIHAVSATRSEVSA